MSTTINIRDITNIQVQKDGVTTTLDNLYATKDGWNRLVWSRYFTAYISGTFYYGKTLTAYTTPSDLPVYGYQWCYATSTSGAKTDIAGATSKTYTLTASDIGRYIYCKVYRNATTFVYTSNQTKVEGEIKYTGNLVTMTSNSAPSPYSCTGEYVGWGNTGDSKAADSYKVYDNNDGTEVQCYMNGQGGHHMQSELRFGRAIRLGKVRVLMGSECPSTVTFSIYNAYIYGIKTDGTYELLASKRYDLKNNINYSWSETLSFNSTTKYIGIQAKSSFESGNVGQRQWIKTVGVAEWYE